MSMIQEQSEQQSLNNHHHKQFMQNMLRVQEQNNTLRKEITHKLNQIFALIKKNPSNAQIQRSKQQIAILLSDYGTDQLIKAISKVQLDIEEMLNSKKQFLEQIQEYLQKKREQLNKVKDSLLMKGRQNEKNEQDLVQRTSQFIALDQQLTNLLDEYWLKKNQIAQKSEEEESHLTIKKLDIEQNWQKQTQFIKLQIQERCQTRNQLLLTQKAHLMLAQKVQEKQRDYEEFVGKRQRNKLLTAQLEAIIVQLTTQRQRKENLLQRKREEVFKRQLIFAGQICEKWKPTQTDSKNLLIRIIDKVNQRLPMRQLKDVQGILDAAEEFDKRGKSQSVENYQASHQKNMNEEYQI